MTVGREAESASSPPTLATAQTDHPTWIVYVLMMATSTIAVIDLLLLSTMIPASPRHAAYQCCTANATTWSIS